VVGAEHAGVVRFQVWLLVAVSLAENPLMKWIIPTFRSAAMSSNGTPTMRSE
jgi:hypothetical protein